MVHSLGSRTSGVDGSSEGGRINTISIPGALVLYGVPLLETLRRQNPRSKLGVAPALVDGIWCLELTHEGDAPDGAPGRWHGHRVVLKKVEPPPPPPPPAPPAAPPTPKKGG
jgi:hypothetical protein